MNLVFFENEKEQEMASLFFPQDEFVQMHTVRSEKEWQAFRQSAAKKIGQKNEKKFGVLLVSADSKLLQKARQAGFLVGVLGKSPNECLFAASQKADYLLQPFGFSKPNWDISILRVASQNNVGIGLFFSDLLKAGTSEKTQWLKNAFFLAKMCKKTKTRFRVFSGSRTFLEHRGEKDLDEFREMLQNE